MMTFLIIPAFAIAYRLRGMDYLHLIGKALCIAGVCFLIRNESCYVIAATALASWGGLVVGHGTYYRLGYEPHAVRKDNWPAWLPRKLGLYRDSWLFNAIALSITGVAFVVPVCLVLVFSGHYLASTVVLLASALKPIAYDIGWKTSVVNATEIGEYLTGFFLGSGIVIANLIIGV